MIKTKKQIMRFVIDAMNKYDINWLYLFDAEDVEGDPIFRGEEIDLPTIKRLSNILGLSQIDILSCNKKAVNKWSKKYSFFEYHKRFMCAENAAQYAPNQYDRILYNAIFYDNPVPIIPRYTTTKKDIEKRMLEYLKKFSRYNPEEYHEGASIVNLTISSRYFIDFPDFQEMFKSYLQMIDIAKELFFKVLHQKASEEERNEYNFLVTILEIKDFIVTPNYMYADWIDAIRFELLNDNYSDFFYYVKIPRSANMELWRCKQFVDDAELAQKYFDVFPFSKSDMRDFYMEMKYFICTYNWSDDPENPYANMDEDELIDLMASNENEAIDSLMNEGDDSSIFKHEDWQLRKVYVPKTDDELGNDKEAILQLKRLSGCIKNGGIDIRNRYLKMTGEDYNKKFLERAMLGRGGL